MSYHIASVSFGKDSIAMLLEIIKRGLPLNEVVFYDTGMEFEATYNMRDHALPILEQHNIKYTELTPSYSFLFKMFELPVIRNEERSCERCKHYQLLPLSWGCCNNPASKYYKTHDEYKGGLPSEKSPYSKGSCKLLELKQHTKYGYSWCGGRCRWGTTDKLQALDKYARSKNAKVYVGIAADESHRLERERKPYKLFPMIEWGMTEATALQLCYDNGFDWLQDNIRLYDILDRVSCWCCCNKNLKELKNIYIYLPLIWERLKELQRRTPRPMKGYYKGKPKGVFELEERFKREIEKEDKQDVKDYRH